MTSHSPRPLDEFLKKLPEDWRRRPTVGPPQRYLLGAQTLRDMEAAGVRLDPWQKEVLARHPAFRNLRQDPSFLELTRQSKIQPRSLWSRLLRRLRMR